ncbi:MAG: ankyrin repeat domain-containing protein [Gammaproteobacteria bacterium]|nr:ankyrin repeat domain-containing protein [Gammaproteobacteria bacterium]
MAGSIPLIDAIKNRQIERVRCLIEETDFKRANKEDVILEAVLSEDVDILSELIKKGFDVNKRNQVGSPLVQASILGHKGMMKTLLANGALMDAEEGAEEQLKEGLADAWTNHADEAVYQWMVYEYPQQVALATDEKRVLEQRLDELFREKYIDKVGEETWASIKDNTIKALAMTMWPKQFSFSESLDGLEEKVLKYEAALTLLQSTEVSALFSVKQKALLTRLMDMLSRLKVSESLAGDGKLHTKMRGLVQDLESSVDGFLQNKMRYKAFKAEVNAYLNDKRALELGKPNSKFHKIYNAVIAVFRAIFRMFDLGWIVGRKTMAETYTPGAQTLIGQKHFFEYADNSMSKELLRLSRYFDKTIQAVDDLILAESKPQPPMS